jgi:hypothetical protein
MILHAHFVPALTHETSLAHLVSTLAPDGDWLISSPPLRTWLAHLVTSWLAHLVTSLILDGDWLIPAPHSRVLLAGSSRLGA